ncbi:MAG: PadR family transcriptional regulator [Promethearchaeota archaeon]
MIKRIKHYDPKAKIHGEKFRSYAEKFESEILRGISTLSILTIIKNHGQNGIYGYQLLQELTQKTNNMLIVDEGTLYPMLKKLEKDGIVGSSRKKISGRQRKYYSISKYGTEIFNHLSGFFAKLMEAIGPILDVEVELKEESYIYCPNCANKIDITDESNTAIRFCIVCGYNIQDRYEKRQNGGKKDEL